MKVQFTRNLFIFLGIDVAILCFSFYFAHQIRFDFNVPEWALERFVQYFPYLFSVKLLCFYYFDLYRGMWRYTGLQDLINVAKATTVASSLVILYVLWDSRFEMVSRGVFFIDWCLTIIGIICIRVATRLIFEEFTGEFNWRLLAGSFIKMFRIGHNKEGRGIIIIGAGDCGRSICREFKENPNVKSHVVGFLDDDEKKISKKIFGVPVLNSINNLEAVIKRFSVDDVIIAIPNAGADRMLQIVNLCQRAGVNFQTVPDMGEVIDGKLTLNSIRAVEYRDLLGRKPVQLDREKIGSYLGNKIIFVTGAGGSIGKGLCRQICRFKPNKIVLFERAESSLYKIDIELRRNFHDVEIIPVLGDVQKKQELATVFDQVKPDIVFHAAAYKHVPMLEFYPWKAVENNVFGTKNLIEVTKAFECEKFVFVSTDKAVNPTNVMGTSKRIAELMVQETLCDADCKTAFMTVRFGNVIGSVGSVIPLFKKQIKEGGPVTVTHPDITRYFMLIPEACQLILQAGAMGAGGETFVLEMGEPVKIDNMARELIKFSGFEPDVDIQIEYTGLRPGEKLYEELMTDKEDVIPTDHKKIMVLNTNSENVQVLNGELGRLKEMAGSRDGGGIRNTMMDIIPEYRPN